MCGILSRRLYRGPLAASSIGRGIAELRAIESGSAPVLLPTRSRRDIADGQADELGDAHSGPESEVEEGAVSELVGRPGEAPINAMDVVRCQRRRLSAGSDRPTGSLWLLLCRPGLSPCLRLLRHRRRIRSQNAFFWCFIRLNSHPSSGSRTSPTRSSARLVGIEVFATPACRRVSSAQVRTCADLFVRRE